MVFSVLEGTRAVVGANSLAEVYGALTGMPHPRRVGGTEALLFLDDVQANLTVVTLTEFEYVEAIQLSRISIGFWRRNLRCSTCSMRTKGKR